MPLRVLENVIAVGSVRSGSTAPVARVSLWLSPIATHIVLPTRLDSMRAT